MEGGSLRAVARAGCIERFTSGICERLWVKFPGPTRHERLGGASGRSRRVRNAPLATVGPKNAACREGP